MMLGSKMKREGQLSEMRINDLFKNKQKSTALVPMKGSNRQRPEEGIKFSARALKQREARFMGKVRRIVWMQIVPSEC